MSKGKCHKNIANQGTRKLITQKEKYNSVAK